MKRRRVIVGLVVLALVAVVLFGSGPRGPRPCRATFRMVQEGMTYNEVCAIVGGPPGDYSTRPPTLFPVADGFPEPLSWEGWEAEDGYLMVLWNGDRRTGKVIVRESNPSSPFQRLLAKLGL
jgi:hypothetical protein